MRHGGTTTNERRWHARERQTGTPTRTHARAPFATNHQPRVRGSTTDCRRGSSSGGIALGVGAATRDSASAVPLAAPGTWVSSEKSTASNARVKASSAMIKPRPGAFAFCLDTAMNADNESDRTAMRVPTCVCDFHSRQATKIASPSNVETDPASPAFVWRMASSVGWILSQNHLPDLPSRISTPPMPHGEASTMKQRKSAGAGVNGTVNDSPGLSLLARRRRGAIVCCA